MKLVVLIQLGTPDAPEEKEIGRYLSEFLMDPRVITIPGILRYILVKWIIVPQRAKKVKARYRMIWDARRGSPLNYHLESLVKKLGKLMPGNIRVDYAMRYGSRSIASVIDRIDTSKYKELLFVPLFPHHTEATTGSIRAEVEKALGDNGIGLPVSWMPLFKDDPAFNGLIANRVKAISREHDVVLFSYHGLPLKQIERSHPGVSCSELGCADLSPENKSDCYTRDCYMTSAVIASMAGIPRDKYMVAFQSRFGKNWIGPQTEDVISGLAAKGKSIIVVPGSFLTDCLETSWEVGISFSELYEDKGGKEFEWVRALNDDDDWVDYLAKRITSLA